MFICFQPLNRGSQMSLRFGGLTGCETGGTCPLKRVPSAAVQFRRDSDKGPDLPLWPVQKLHVTVRSTPRS